MNPPLIWMPPEAGRPRPPTAEPRVLPVVQPRSVDCRLDAHLRAWLGAWPPRRELDLIVWPGRDEPGWDGGVWLGLGVEGPTGIVLSLSPAVVPDAAQVDTDRVLSALRSPDAPAAVPAALGRDDLSVGCAVLRWSAAPALPAALAPIGTWVDPQDPRLPPWLRPFNGGALVAWDEQGLVAAGVGIKRHNPHGHELAVGTELAHRGKGLARALVAEAARRVLSAGAVPLYLHEAGNVASARVADAAGFADRGWRVWGLLPVLYPAP